jgi:hypothetical protein
MKQYLLACNHDDRVSLGRECVQSWDRHRCEAWLAGMAKINLNQWAVW